MTDTLFISHASDDSEVVGPIVSYLEANGVRCWIASRDIPPRAIYAEAITKGVADAAACAVIVSKAANESDAIKRELELASHYRKRFIPIRVDKTEPGPGLDYYLRNTQWMDYGRERHKALDRIVTHFKDGSAPAIVNPPRRTPDPPSVAPVTPPARSPWPIIIGVAIAVLAIGVGLLTLGQGGSSDQSPIEPQITATQSVEYPSEDTGAESRRIASERAQAEQLTRERDEAMAAARAAQEQLAAERANAQRQPTYASVVGTWRGTNSWDSAVFIFQFTADGRLIDGPEIGQWTQTADRVSWSQRVPDGQMIYFTATISGNRMDASARASGGGTGTAVFVRQ